jgi:hypothetical protein
MYKLTDVKLLVLTDRNASHCRQDPIMEPFRATQPRMQLRFVRTRSEVYSKRSSDLDAKAKGTIEQVHRLCERARAMRAELDACNEHVAQLEEENHRWRERNSRLLTKVCLFICLARCTISTCTDSCLLAV